MFWSTVEVTGRFPSRSALKMESDLFDLQSTFQPSMQSGSAGLPVATAWAGKDPCPTTSQHPPISTINFNQPSYWSTLTCCACSLMSTPLTFSFTSACLSHSLSLSVSSLPLCAFLDPFTSAEAGDDSMPNLNPFLSKIVVDAAHIPVVSSDGVSFPSRTSAHEMFGGKRPFFCLSPPKPLLSLL